MPSAVTRQVWVIAIGVGFVMAGLTLVAPILPLYALEFGVSYTAAGALITGFAVARLLFSVIGGVAGDRWGARRVTVFGTSLLAISSVTAALAPNYGVLLGSRFIEGVGSAIFATTAFQYLLQVTPKERLGRATAAFQTGLLVGVAIGPFVGGFLAELGDFRTPFWAYAFLAALVAVLAWFFIEDLPSRGTSARQVFAMAGKLMRSRAYLALMLVGFSMMFMRGGARVTLLPLYAEQSLGFGAGDIGILLSVSALTNLLIVNPAGRFVDRVGRKPVAMLGLTTAAIATAGYGLFESFTGLLIVSMVFGITSGMASIAPPTMVGDLAPEGAEGSAVGVYRMSGDLGFVIGPLALGAIADTGAFTLGFFLTGAVMLLAAALLAFVPETRRSHTPEPVS
ncbi:MAG: MFS transporter [Acidimicrobiia bacterium]|nr:MFS transporter [Acidimicrobiia bacterium]